MSTQFVTKAATRASLVFGAALTTVVILTAFSVI
jgi:hypothetical protein